MATQVSTIETNARLRLVEPNPRFWSSAELVEIIAAGIRDLWRATVDLKQEYYLTVNETDVVLESGADTLSGVPLNVHKVYLIEPLDNQQNESNAGLIFRPLDYNHKTFQGARALSSVDPSNATIYYSVTSEGAPVNAPTIRVAPTVSADVALRFAYVPTIGNITSNSIVPIPGEADNALVAWTVAYARAKEREDRAPDPHWLTVYSGEKANLLASLGVRQVQEPMFVDAMFEEYWG